MTLLMMLMGCFLFETELHVDAEDEKMKEVRKVAQNQPPRAPLEIKRKEWPSEQTAAPDRSVWGLTLGETTAKQAKAWLEARKLECDEVPSPRRLTTQFRCGTDISNDAFPERRLGGTVSNVLLSRIDGEPIHYVELLRNYSDPKLAITDVTHAIEQIKTRLGDAHQPFKEAPTPEHFSGPIAHFETSWRYQDVRATLTLYKMAGPNVSIREVWRVPGKEKLAQVRPGSKGHGTQSADKPQSPHGIVE